MLSPRHRWIAVAQRLGLPYQADGLSFRVTLDKQGTELFRVCKDPGKGSKVYNHAYRTFLSDSARTSIEIILFATLSVGETARILKAFPEHIQTYADCFFDVSIFGKSPTDRLIYLDRLITVDEDLAFMLRNAMGMSEKELGFIADKGSAERVDPKSAIENGLKLYHNMMQTFIQPELELLVQENVSEERQKRFDKLFGYAKDCSKESRAYAELMLKYELDKTADAFLENFKLALTPKTAEQLMVPKPKEGEGPELV